MRRIEGYINVTEELEEKVNNLLGPEEKVFQEKLLRMIDANHGAFLGSSIELMIRKQGLEKTKQDLNTMANTIAKLIEILESPTVA